MKKVLISIGILFLLLIAIIIVAPIIYKDKIVALVKKSANEQLNAQVNFGKFELTLIRNFPNITICLNDLSIVGTQPFEGDTLTYAKEFAISLDLMSVISGSKIKVKSIKIDEALINLMVLKDGKVNWDIMKPSPASTGETPPSDYQIALNSYEVTNSTIRYNDQPGGMRVSLQQVNHSGHGDFTQDLFTLSTNTTIEKTNVWYGGLHYLNNVKSALTADLDIDMRKSKYTFKQNELKLNDLSLAFDGYVAMPGSDILMDIKFKSGTNTFGSFISLIPAIYYNDYKQLKSSGSLAFEGFVKGTYNEKEIPGFNIKLAIKDGMFQYPSLPAAVKNVQVDLDVTNPDGVPDHTVINLKRLHVEMGSDPFDAHMYVSTPVSDANIDAAAKGKINLGNIQKIIPLEKGTLLSGILLADITAKGRMSSIEKKQYENFTAAGSVAIAGMTYNSNTYPQGVTINQFLLTFNPKNVTLNNCDLKTGSSDLKANGTLDNFLPYFFKDETLKGALTINSTQININELMASSPESTETTATIDTQSFTVVEIPANIDFNLTTAIGKVIYDDLQLQNLQGNISMQKEILQMNGLTFNTLGGSVKMNGMYNSANPKEPEMDYNLVVSNIDIQQAAKTLETLQKMAPITERCTGNVSASFTIAGSLDSHMQPLLNTLSGGGTLKTGKVVLSNFEPVSKMADVLKMPQYKQLSLNDVNLSFKFKDGRVAIVPFETTLAGTKAKIEGSNGFDQTIDYTVNLSIPQSQMGPQASGVMNNLVASANKATGTSFSIPDPVNVKVLIGGTVTNPVIKTGLKDAAMSITESVKEEVQELVEEKIEEGKEMAKAEADKLILEAEKQAKLLHDAAVLNADKLTKEGYAAADKLIAQAKDPISKAAAKVAADKMKKETDAQAAQLIKAADDQGKKLIDDAKKQSAALLQ
jgi:hypothetical protein